MEANKNEEVGVEIITQHNNVWDVDFEETTKNTGKIWQDPFSDSDEQYSDEEEDDSDKPLLEKDVETSVEEETEKDSDTDEFTTDNPVYFLAKQAVNDGLLPSDIEIPEDVDLGFIYNTYRDNVKPLVEREVLSEVEKRLSSAGIKEDNITLLQAIENGTPIDEIYEVTKYKKYSSLNEEVDDSEKKKVIKEWYNKRGLTEKEQQRNLDAIELDDEVDSEFNDAKNFFGSLVEQFDENQLKYTEERRNQELALQQRNQSIINSLSTEFVLGDEKLAKSDAELIINSIYSKQPVQFNGQVYELSPYEQFYVALNNDFEFSLKVFKDFMLKDKKEAKLKNELKEEAENDWLQAYKKAREKSSSTTSIKRNTKTSAPVSKTTDTGGIYMEI